MEIEGVFRPISPVYRALDLLLFGTLYLLFCASGVVMIYAGLWAALHRDDHSGLWILLPTGVFYLLIINLGMYLRYVVVPRRTVRKFRYDGERLTYRTDRTGESVARGLGEYSGPQISDHSVSYP